MFIVKGGLNKGPEDPCSKAQQFHHNIYKTNPNETSPTTNLEYSHIKPNETSAMKIITLSTIILSIAHFTFATKRHPDNAGTQDAKRRFLSSYQSQNTKPLEIYHLVCADAKHYIGQSIDVDARFKQHLRGKGSAFTRKYKPLYIKQRELASNIARDPKDAENIYTKKVMREEGIPNVRGGSYCQLELPDWQVKAIEHEQKSYENRCYRCNELGHMISACDMSEEEEDEVLYQSSSDEEEEEQKCGRCYRRMEEHNGGYCSWKTDVVGKFIGYRTRSNF